MPRQKLTQQFIDRITLPKKGKVDYFDTETTGLLFKVLPSGTKTFACRYRGLRGKQIEKRLGCADALKLSEARQLVRNVQAKLAFGEDPFETRQVLKSVPLFADFVADSYMPYIKGYKRSWETDESLLRNHVLPKLGKLHLDEIKPFHINELLNNHRQTYKPASTNRVIILIRYIFNCAIKWEVTGLVRNPTQGIDLLLENNKRDRYLNKEEALRLFQAMEGSSNKQLPFIITMLLLTGARKSEVLNARWQDLDFEARSWRIEFNKTGLTRHVPISNALVSLFEKMPRFEGNDFIFPNPNTGEPFVNIFNSWNKVRIKAGLKDVRIHDLRHSFASFLINEGRSLYEVQKLLGHTQIATTQRYAHLSNESLLSAADSAAESVPWDKAARQKKALEPKLIKTVTTSELKVSALLENNKIKLQK